MIRLQSISEEYKLYQYSGVFSFKFQYRFYDGKHPHLREFSIENIFPSFQPLSKEKIENKRIQKELIKILKGEE